MHTQLRHDHCSQYDMSNLILSPYGLAPEFTSQVDVLDASLQHAMDMSAAQNGFVAAGALAASYEWKTTENNLVVPQLINLRR